MLFYFLLGVIALCVYYGLTYHYGYWKKRGVPHPPVSILFGNIKESVFFKKSLGQVYNKVYDDYPELSYVGFYKMRQPAIILRDPDLIKEVLVKSFHSFHDNDFEVDEKADPLFSKNPFVLKGHAWKVTRNQVTPSFTGKRIKAMYPLMEAVCKRLVNYLEETPMAKDGINVQDVAEKYTSDNVASCAFGLEANAFKDPNSEFRLMGKTLLNPSFITALKFLIFFICPPLAGFLSFKLIEDNVAEYFKAMVEKSLEFRKKNNMQRDDFLDAMNELKNKLGENNFNNDDITAHALGFFLDGYATSSIVISFTLYELGANPDVQNKLKEEIDATLRENGDKFTYDAIQGMSYLDKIFTESLRKHPAVLFMARICTEPFTLPSPSGVGPDVVIEPETRVIIPVLSIHEDSKYYSDPDRFDPERFSDANKEVHTKNTYFAFGDGPRVCLGQRFGLTQSKMAIAFIVANFEIRVNSKTVLPLEVDPQHFLNTPKGGLWLNFYKRR